MQKLLLFLLTLCTASLAYSDDALQFARPLHLNADTMTIVYEGKKYLLVNETWMETKAPNKADVKFDNVWLPTDKLKLSISKEKEDVNKHLPLNPVLTYTKNVSKYNPTSENIPSEEQNRILGSDSALVLKVEGNESVPFTLLVGDTALVKGENWVTGKEISIPLSLLGLDELCSNIVKTESKSIGRIQVIPQGHVPSYVKELHCVYNEDTSLMWIAPKTASEKFIEDYLWYIIAAAIVLLAAIGYIVYFFFFAKKKKLKKTEPDSLYGDSIGISAPVNLTPQEEVSNLKRKLILVNQKVDSYEKQLDSNNRKIAELTQQKDKLQQDINSAREDERNRCKKELDTLREDKQKLKDSLEEEKASAKKRISELQDEMKQKVSDAREDEKKKSEKKIADLNAEVSDLNASLHDIKNDLSQTTQALDKKTTEWEQDEKTIAEMKEAQRIYTERISFVPFAEQYAKSIERLLSVAAKINESAKNLAETNVEDPYLIYKAISRFSMAEKEIDFDTFLCDVTMASKSQLAFSNSGIANLSTVAEGQLQSSMRSYFLSNYLEKYINAVMVYNESLAGIHRLVAGLTPGQTAPFAEYREELKVCFKQLGISVISVKLFDTLGDNMDLKATMVDYDESIPAESILEIQNCLVYPEGGHRPTDKIYVKAQK